MQALPPPPPRRALEPSPVVPFQQGPAAALPPPPAGPTGAPAGGRTTPEPAPASDPGAPAAVPSPRHELFGQGRFRGDPRPRPATPDTVVFTAPCPACGADATWSEAREDTRLRSTVECPCA